MNSDSPLVAEPKRKPVARDRDGLFKKRGIWQYRIQINGRWRQFSTGTRNNREAKQKRHDMLQAEAEGKLPTDQSTARLSLIVPLWLEERKRRDARSDTADRFISKVTASAPSLWVQ